MILQKTSHTTQAKCLQELIDGPDLHTECWIDPIVPKSGKLIFGGYSKTGKALRIDQLVLLKTGDWRQIDDIKEGDELASVDGETSIVLAREYHSSRRLFKVSFSDGSESITADDHLWEIHSHNWTYAKILTTEELLKTKTTRGIYIPLCTGDFGTEQEFPVDPYLLGALLGDGGLTEHTISFTSADPEIVQQFIDKYGKESIYQKPNESIKYRIKTKRVLENALTDLGLYGCNSYTKFIPPCYFTGSKNQRLALLQGLMDTDGTVSKTGAVEYCTISPTLAQGVINLIRSLGWGCTYSKRITTYTANGIKKYGQESYRIYVRGGGINCFRLKRKLTRAAGKYKNYMRYITDVTEIDPGPAICIEVSHPRGLFITNDYIVTHNSHIMLSMARAITTQENLFDCPRFRVPEPAKVLLFEQELGEAGLQKRARMVFRGANIQQPLRYISRNPDFTFSTEKGYELIGNEIAEFRPNIVILDPIGKLFHGDENSAQEVGLLWQKIDRLLRLGNREQLSIILSAHYAKRPNGARNSEGYDPLDAYNFRGSSKWFDDVDALITLNRLQNLPTQHQAWRLQARFELRHSEVPPEMYFTVNRERDLRVRYERDVDPPQNNMSLQPIRRSNNTTDPAARR